MIIRVAVLQHNIHTVALESIISNFWSEEETAFFLNSRIGEKKQAFDKHTASLISQTFLARSLILLSACIHGQA